MRGFDGEFVIIGLVYRQGLQIPAQSHSGVADYTLPVETICFPKLCALTVSLFFLGVTIYVIL